MFLVNRGGLAYHPQTGTPVQPSWDVEDFHIVAKDVRSVLGNEYAANYGAVFWSLSFLASLDH